MNRNSAPVSSLTWIDISTRDLPIKEDAWVGQAVSANARPRWYAWLSMPRYRVCYDFPTWAVVVLAFTDEARGGPLMQMLRDNVEQRRAAAFAICRTTRQLFRLDRLPILADAAAAGDAGPVIAEAPHDAFDAGYVPRSSEWHDPDRRMIWESLLANPIHWSESQCAQSLLSGLWLPELVSPDVDSELGDFGWLSTVGEEPAIAARPFAERRRGSRELNRRERRIAHLALTEISRHCRPDIEALAASAGIGPVAEAAVAYNWLCSGSEAALPRRVQALAAAPVLLPLLLQVSNTSETRGADMLTSRAIGGEGIDELQLRAELDRVVDVGEPLFPLIARTCHVSERTVRHLRRSSLRQHTFKPLLLLSPRKSWRAFSRTCLGFVAWLDHIPIERWPQTPRQWRTWAELMSAAERTFDASRVFAARSGVDDNAAQLYRFAEGLFKAEAANGWRNRRFDSPGWTPERDYDGATFAVRELVRSIELVAQADTAAMDVEDDGNDRNDRDGDRNPAFDRFDYVYFCALSDQRAAEDASYAKALAELRSWSMAQWHDAAQRWHALWVPEAELGGVEVLDEDEDEEDDQALNTQNAGESDWLALFAVSGLPELVETLSVRHERSLVWLTSPRALAREARAMQHCVASYTEECAHRREHIASIRDLSGVRQSTLRVRLHYVDGQWVAQLVEHRGMMNGLPSEACVAAVRSVMTALTSTDGSDDLQARWTALEAARKLRWTAGALTSAARHRESVAGHTAVLDQVLPPGMTAALSA